MKLDAPSRKMQSLHRRFVFYEGHHDVPGIRRWLAPNDDDVAGEDASAAHALSAHAKGEQLTTAPLLRNGDIPFRLLDGCRQRACLHPAEEGNVEEVRG